MACGTEGLLHGWRSKPNKHMIESMGARYLRRHCAHAGSFVAGGSGAMIGTGTGAGVGGMDEAAVIARGARSLFLWTTRQPGRTGSEGPSIIGGGVSGGGGGAGSSIASLTLGKRQQMHDGLDAQDARAMLPSRASTRLRRSVWLSWP
jgi:hypothetical protein